MYTNFDAHLTADILTSMLAVMLDSEDVSTHHAHTTQDDTDYFAESSKAKPIDITFTELPIDTN